MTVSSERASLLEVLESSGKGSLLVPGVFDALSARLAEQSGFEAAYLSGLAVAATSRALPDIGLIGRAELAEVCRAISASSSIPLIVDGDTGYGDTVVVSHTVAEHARAGAAAVTIEDQQHQKRCGYTEGVTVVSREELARRITAAADAGRANGGLTVIGRTDAAGVNGLDDAVSRAVLMHDAGADITWILGLQRLSQEELAEVRAAIPGRAMIDYTEIDTGVGHTFDSMAAAGFEVVLVPLSTVMASVLAMTKVLRTLREQGDWTPYRDDLVSLVDLHALAGLPQAIALEERLDEAAARRPGEA